jgi:hypothetical protein
MATLLNFLIPMRMMRRRKNLHLNNLNNRSNPVYEAENTVVEFPCADHPTASIGKR